MAEIYHMEDEWNDPTISFAAIRMNVDDIQSSGDSKLVDLRVGGITKFCVFKDGSIFGLSGVATSGQGALADTALQPGDDIDLLENNIGFLTEVPSQWTFSANSFGKNLKTTDTTLQLALDRLNLLEVGGGGDGNTFNNSTISYSGDVITINDSGVNNQYLTNTLNSGSVFNSYNEFNSYGTYLDSGVVNVSGGIYHDSRNILNSGTYTDNTTIINNGTYISGVASVNGDTGPYVTLDVATSGHGHTGMLVSGADISALNNNVPYLSGTQATYGWTDVGFSGNLAVGDDTLQEIFDKVDNLSTGGGGGAVDSVNGEVGVVELDYSDVGAEPLDPLILRVGSGVSALTNDAGYLTAVGTKHKDMVLVCSDEDTELTFPTTPDPVLTFWNPTPFEVTGIKYSLNSPPVGTSFAFDVDVSGGNMGNYVISAGSNEGSTVQAQTIAAGDKVEISVTTVGGTFGGAGFKVYLLGYRP